MSAVLSPYTKVRKTKATEKLNFGGSKAPDLHRKHAAIRDPGLIHQSRRVSDILEKRNAERERLVKDELEPGPELSSYQAKLFSSIIRSRPPGTFTESDRPAINAYLDICELYRIARKRCKVMGCFSAKPPLKADLTWDMQVMKARKEALAEMIRLSHSMTTQGIKLRALLGQSKLAEKFHFDKLSDLDDDSTLYLEAVQEEAEESRDTIAEIAASIEKVMEDAG